MKTLTKVLSLALLALGFLLPSAAGAQTYPSPPTPEVPTEGTGGQPPEGEVLPNEEERPPTGGGEVGGPGGEEPTGEEPTDEGAVLPNTIENTAGAGAGAETAPSGSLPITGGDVVGLAAMGAAALAIGGAMVVRSRRMRSTATA